MPDGMDRGFLRARGTRTATGEPLVIELVGLPGAGKTTSILPLRNALASRGIDSRTGVRLRRAPRFPGRSSLLARALRALWYGWYRARSVIRYRGAVTTAIRALARSSRALEEKGPAFRRFAMTLDNYDSLRQRSATERPGVAIIDEGVAQNSFTLFVNPAHERRARHQELATYVERAPVPDFLVYLRAEPRTCLARLRSRTPIGVSGRFAELDASALERTFAVGALVLEQVISRMARRGCVVSEISPDALEGRSPVWEQVAERIARAAEGVENATTRLQTRS